MAKSKGFTSFEVYELETAIARKEGWEKAQSNKRKQELERVKTKEYVEAMDTTPKFLTKLDNGIAKMNKGIDMFTKAIR